MSGHNGLAEGRGGRQHPGVVALQRIGRRLLLQCQCAGEGRLDRLADVTFITATDANSQ